MRSWRYSPDSDAGRYIGEDIGGEVSGFVVAAPPGTGPRLHRHPYTETFVVLEGRVRFEVADDVIELAGGDLIVAPANTWHRFEAIEPLRMVTVHASPKMVQEDR